MKKPELLGTLLLLIICALFPIAFPSPTWTSIGVFALLYACVVVSRNIFSGYTGYVSLGHATFFGIGAYAFALLMEGFHLTGDYLPFALLLPVGIISSLAAIPIGWIMLRTRKHVFVVVTVAFVFILQLLAYNLRPITKGSAGFYLQTPAWGPDFFNIPYYYVSFLLLLLAVLLSWWVRRSKYGLGLLAIREDEDRARSFGMNTEAYKLSALVLSAFFTGTAGAMVSYFTGSVSPPDAFSPAFDIAIALMGFFGGVGTLIGPLLGALLLEPLQQYITLEYGAISLDKIIFGLLLLGVILLFPDGIIVSLPHLWARIRPARKAADLPALKEEQSIVVAESNKQRQG